MLVLVAAAAIFAGIDSVLIRTILVLPLALALPGYALTTALFRGRATRVAERLVLSLGLSLAVTVVGGVLLDWTPWGLQARSWVLLLGSITLSATAWTAYQERGRPLTHTGRPWMGLDRSGWTRLALAALVMSLAVTVGITGALLQPRPGFTQLWMLPVDALSARVGVHNMEGMRVQYRLQVLADGTCALQWPLIDLEHNEQWERTIELSSELPDPGLLEAVLCRVDAADTTCRRVALRLDEQADAGGR
jgi:uncharacterized membrane protein